MLDAFLRKSLVEESAKTELASTEGHFHLGTLEQATGIFQNRKLVATMQHILS